LRWPHLLDAALAEDARIIEGEINHEPASEVVFLGGGGAIVEQPQRQQRVRVLGKLNEAVALGERLALFALRVALGEGGIALCSIRTASNTFCHDQVTISDFQLLSVTIGYAAGALELCVLSVQHQIPFATTR